MISARSATSLAGIGRPRHVSVRDVVAEMRACVDDLQVVPSSPEAYPARPTENRGSSRRRAGSASGCGPWRRGLTTSIGGRPAPGGGEVAARATIGARTAPSVIAGPILEHRLDAGGEGVWPRRGHEPARRRLDDRRPGRRFLVGVPRRGIEAGPFGKIGRHRPKDLRRLVEAAQELVGLHPGRGRDVLPAAVDEDEPPAPLAERLLRPTPRRSRRTRGPRERPRRQSSAPDPSATAIDVRRQDRRFVAPGRRIRQAVAAQVHRDDAPLRQRARRATGAHDQAVFDRPWMSTTPGLPSPPQSRKWIRSPVSETTTKPAGSIEGSTPLG